MSSASESSVNLNHFHLRRIHSLLGIFPIGVFLIEHMLTNSLAWLGPERFNEQVHWLHDMHYLLFLEILFIFIPLALHAAYGLVIAFQAKHNAFQYPYMDNWRFLLQRWTGIVAVVFVLVHLGHFRFAHFFGGAHYVGTPDPFLLTSQGFAIASLGVIWYPLYVIGLLCAVYHFANGICTFCITWGITIGEGSRRRMSYVSAVVGLVLAVWGLMSLAALATTQPENHGPSVTETAPVENHDPVAMVETD